MYLQPSAWKRWLVHSKFHDTRLKLFRQNGNKHFFSLFYSLFCILDVNYYIVMSSTLLKSESWKQKRSVLTLFWTFLSQVVYAAGRLASLEAYKSQWLCETSESAIPLLQNTQIKQISGLLRVSAVIMKEVSLYKMDTGSARLKRIRLCKKDNFRFSSYDLNTVIANYSTSSRYQMLRFSQITV